MSLPRQNAEFAASIEDLTETADAFSLQEDRDNHSYLNHEQEATDLGMRVKTPQQLRSWLKYQAGLVYKPRKK